MARNLSRRTLLQIIIHRINTLDELGKVPSKLGVEVDVRGHGDKLLLSHDPIISGKSYCELEEYLSCYQHEFIIFNMKEAGYETRVLELARKYKITNYFLLDVEFPYLYNATRNLNIRNIAVRYSEAEPIESVTLQRDENGKPLCDWVWIDTNTKLPLDPSVISKLKGFKTCLVCPERWGRARDILKYKKMMKSLDFLPSAVMTSLERSSEWQ